MNVAAPRRMTRPGYLGWAEEQTGRFERIDGIPVAMPRERVGHGRLKSSLWRLLDNAIEEHGLLGEAFSGVAVPVGQEHDFTPDVVVAFGLRLPGSEILVREPAILVEVLSPSTSARDLTLKRAAYFELASVRHYLVIRSAFREIIHFRRGDDGVVASENLRDGVLRLDPPGLAVAVADIYRDTDVPPHP